MNKYLVTYPGGSRLLFKGHIERTETGQVWLLRNGKRLWFVPAGAIRLLDRVEFLVFIAQGVRVIE